MNPRIISLDADTRLPAAAGGKARGLQLIIKAGLPVPPAWIVLPGARHADICELAADLPSHHDAAAVSHEFSVQLFRERGLAIRRATVSGTAELHPDQH